MAKTGDLGLLPRSEAFAGLTERVGPRARQTSAAELGSRKLFAPASSLRWGWARGGGSFCPAGMTGPPPQQGFSPPSPPSLPAATRRPNAVTDFPAGSGWQLKIPNAPAHRRPRPAPDPD